MKAIYNAHELTVPAVIERLRFRTSDNTNNARHAVVRELLQLRIMRYLVGTGHVQGAFSDGMLPDTPGISTADVQDPGFRCRLFLKAINDSTAIPPYIVVSSVIYQ